ncbi:hypothetical protein AT236_00590 [Lactobacillus delbrueckii subsp. bulgaricus]|nr:hypothetical protein AT236_00590 [Lactobacillus delbrueckii subsp. bulgaricus]
MLFPYTFLLLTFILPSKKLPTLKQSVKYRQFKMLNGA